MISTVKNGLFVVLTVLAAAVALEAGYRGFLIFRFPERFEYSEASNAFSVINQPMWQFDKTVGYTYVPNVQVETAVISGGRVAGCTTTRPVNSQGNIGPITPDYDGADLKVALYGDSFSAFQVDNTTWPALLEQALIERGVTASVLNLAVDGYSILQMVSRAAATLPDLKPDLAIIAFNSSASTRARTWRMRIDEGYPRFVVSVSSDRPPKAGQWSDIISLDPELTADWCSTMLATPAVQQGADPRLAEIVRRRRMIDGTGVAKALDVKSSYVLDMLFTGNPFSSQWAKLGPGSNPILDIESFDSDEQFVSDVRAISNSGIPVLLVHLPLGVSLRDHQEFLFDHPNTQPLLNSLESAFNQSVTKLGSRISVSNPMDICLTPDNCHPSLLGMQVYADAVAGVVTER